MGKRQQHDSTAAPAAVPTIPAADRKPINVDQMDVAFGKVSEILPPMADIPNDYPDRAIWEKWQSDWFFHGLKTYPVPKDGIDRALALRNLACVQNSWAPKHEHKLAGVAYLASLWFTSPNGEPIPAKAAA